MKDKDHLENSKISYLLRDVKKAIEKMEAKKNEE